ncbi:Sulfite exporter TauE/SafE [Corynebacterium felinum]|uniref:Probable membrane transporter protein n=1 Tax=Corynebacterium felinum TaxID=131318 RepID=A0ABU2BCJ7_9CORY|nr:putative membrane protein YfcA [Corynebacterium felinum]WJY94819.1 Sulfite exporter TauE/SafE [Corynebacterium felinum]
MLSAGIGLGLIVFLIVFTGSFLQRVSGMGLGLVAGPVLSVLLDPITGILVVNVLAVVNAAMTTASVRQWVDWHRFKLIAPVLLVGAIPGAWLITVTGPGLLQVIVGALLLFALALVTMGAKFMPEVRGNVPAVTSGIVGGFMNTLAGVAGPAITVYAQAAKWEQRSYAATLQPIFIVSGLVSILTKVVFIGTGTLTAIEPVVWVCGVAAMVVGIKAGTRVSAVFPREKARALALFLASAGGVTALVRGLLAL